MQQETKNITADFHMQAWQLSIVEKATLSWATLQG